MFLGASAVVLDFWRSDWPHQKLPLPERGSRLLSPTASRRPCSYDRTEPAASAGWTVPATIRSPGIRHGRVGGGSGERPSLSMRVSNPVGSTSKHVGKTLRRPGHSLSRKNTHFRSGVQHSDDAEPGGGRVTVTEDDAGRLRHEGGCQFATGCSAHYPLNAARGTDRTKTSSVPDAEGQLMADATDWEPDPQDLLPADLRSEWVVVPRAVKEWREPVLMWMLACVTGFLLLRELNGWLSHLICLYSPSVVSISGALLRRA
jgi:hypothetical protein